MVSTVASQKEGPGFESKWAFLCRVGLLSLSLHEFSLDTLASSSSPKT